MVLFLAACGGGVSDKKAKLEQLRKEHDKIAEEIRKLELELKPNDSVAATKVTVAPLTRQPFEHYIEVQGRIDGNENIAVNPRNQGGMVTSILVHEGQAVTRGQVLAELDAEVLKQQLTDLRNKLGFVTDLYNRQKMLWDQKIGSEIQYLKAKNDMETVQNGIATLEEQIKMSVIISPINGTVEDIPIKVGQLASPASTIPAFRIVNFSRAKVLADVGEAYSARVQTGDPVKVLLPDLGQELVRKVTFVSKYINPTNRTFLVEAEVTPSDIVFRANMIAVVRIKDYTNPAAISVPQNFIQTSRDEGQFIFIAADENGRKIARKRIVTTGMTYNGLTEILNGLNEGDRIITAGYKDLYNGQLIDF
ncbi:MAG TPA: efflux RND transporter periplasmic adaptor subunit [Bacteroidales bacterium]|nr:efflux RND transporter periplasmic adaptor subunit [Bacteroidales bacterium]HPS62885.1 efflux RND transporter periplasmic adaptor subunit [Bacteroidales bacterium]